MVTVSYWSGGGRTYAVSRGTDSSQDGEKRKRMKWQNKQFSVARNRVWGFLFLKKSLKKVKVLVTQSCPTLCNLMDYSLSGSSIHGILQARILDWAAIPFSRGSSQSGDRTQVSCIAGRFFTVWARRDKEKKILMSILFHEECIITILTHIWLSDLLTLWYLNIYIYIYLSFIYSAVLGLLWWCSR